MKKTSNSLAYLRNAGPYFAVTYCIYTVQTASPHVMPRCLNEKEDSKLQASEPTLNLKGCRNDAFSPLCCR